MNDDDPEILELAEAISDDQPIDWAFAERSAPDPARQAVIRELSLIARLAHVCRQPDAVISSEPDGEQTDAGSTTVEGGLATWAHLRLLERVGAGGFGYVFRSWDTRLGREVALKLLRPSLASAREATTIVREGGMLARVRHPNVVTVYGAETIDGEVGIWMEFVRGRTLAQLVAEDGVLGAEEAALIGITLCRATAAVHNAGVVHRDIKPQNVMREEGGRIVLMDFGLGRDIANAPHSSSWNLAGTPLYLAPELLAGGGPSVASDIYSLGVLLYFLVTGTYPVLGKGLEEVRAAHQQGTRRLLHDVRANLPPPFVGAVERALSGDPSQRFKTCGAMESALSHVIGAEARASLAPASSDVETRSTSRTERFRPHRHILAATTLVALLVSVWALGTGTVRRWLGRGDVQPPRVLMVLPFVNQSQDPDQQHLTDGVADILTADLAGISGLRIISWTTSLRYRHTQKRVSEIASELPVDAVIEGSVQRSGDRLRVTARLIHAKSDSLLWASTYERDAADLFALQGEIAAAIAGAIRVTLTGPEQSRLTNRHVTRPAAQDAYLQGRRHLYSFNIEGVRRARDLFELAVKEDPRYALAHASLARCYLALQDFGVMTPEDARLRATTAAATALAIDDALPEAHTAVAEVRFKLDWDWLGAEQSYLAALGLNPGSSLVRSPYSRFLSALGRTREALEQARLAAESDPLSAEMRTSIGVILYYQRRHNEAVSEYLKALELNASFSPARVGLGRAYAAAGQYDDAVHQLRLAIEQSGNAWNVIAVLAGIHAEAGVQARS